MDKAPRLGAWERKEDAGDAVLAGFSKIEKSTSAHGSGGLAGVAGWGGSGRPDIVDDIDIDIDADGACDGVIGFGLGDGAIEGVVLDEAGGKKYELVLVLGIVVERMGMGTSGLGGCGRCSGVGTRRGVLR